MRALLWTEKSEQQFKNYLFCSGTMIDAGTTMFIIKLGKRMPDDLSVAREAKVNTFFKQLIIVL